LAGGLYVHVPFCEQACSYCAFSIVVGKEDLIPDYLRALRMEWEIRRTDLAFAPSTLFIGGGTPSQLGAVAMAELLGIFEDEELEEITVEVNPESLTRELVEAMISGGVTRVSVGVQSFDGEVLKSFRRAHDPEQACEALSLLQSLGVRDVSVDLIFGAICESDASWERTLTMALDPEFALTHVSCYGLTVEKRTRLHVEKAQHPDEDVLANRYRFADEFLAAHGLLDYEISNWARPGHHCRHNLNYWRRAPYLGLGVSAHSFDGEVRSWNDPSFRRYLDSIEETGSASAGSERLSEAEVRHEEILLGLRCGEGVVLERVALPDDLRSLVEIRSGRYHLKPEAKILADSIISAVIAVES
jgi:oxygen-independent coproporphyrinogen-3 oxidase